MIYDVPLSAKTTLAVGGPAWAWVDFHDLHDLEAALNEAVRCRRGVLVLGEGSNVVAPDEGLDVVVLHPASQLIAWRDDGRATFVKAAAGVRWDDLVHATVARGLAGIEAMSGIPGLVGAAPVQNIGAYGQELADVLVEVEAYDLDNRVICTFTREACQLGYRTSRFKEDDRDRFIILSVSLALERRHGVVRYDEITRELELDHRPRAVSPVEVRAAVWKVRSRKSMVLHPDDPNARSVGSFFVNPAVSSETYAAVVAAAESRGLGPVPGRPGGEDRMKIPAAWLLEASGARRGETRGAAGISSRHALALINRGGARASDILELAHELQRRVRDAFGIEL
ncbi:MAG: UDP-N-acetylmuramate dehydrogenase, partial [Myxococcales bacterium]|nr:UDP-N-acetylmuramate dehydrogenase [Myxococcales bacterium]